MKKLLFTVIFGMLATVMFSQFSVGAKAGMTVSTLSNIRSESKAAVGYKAGISAQYMLSSHWGLQSGIYLLEAGVASSEGLLPDKTGGSHLATMSLSPKYFEIPLSAVYKYPIDDHVKLSVNAGGYYAFKSSGKGLIRYDNGSLSINPFEPVQITNHSFLHDLYGEQASREDWGLSIGVGVDLYNFNLSVHYNYGLMDVFKAYPIDLESKKLKNRIVWIALGYNFNL